MSEMTQEEALCLADALVRQAVQETEARCSLLAEFISDCDRTGSRPAAWSQALGELHALHRRRSGLIRRRVLILQALERPVDESPAQVQLSPPPDRNVCRVQRQAQIQARRLAGPVHVAPVRRGLGAGGD